MKVYKFQNKQQAKVYAIFTVIGMALSIIIFSSLDIYIDASIASLLISILGVISITVSIKNASKEFEEIKIDENNVKLYFINKLKKPLEIQKSDLYVENIKEQLVYKKLTTSEFIGRVYKNRLEEPEKWHQLIESFKLLH